MVTPKYPIITINNIKNNELEFNKIYVIWNNEDNIYNFITRIHKDTYSKSNYDCLPGLEFSKKQLIKVLSRR